MSELKKAYLIAKWKIQHEFKIYYHKFASGKCANEISRADIMGQRLQDQ